MSEAYLFNLDRPGGLGWLSIHGAHYKLRMSLNYHAEYL